MTWPAIYQNQHNFIDFWSQLCMLLFLETRGTPDFWRLASCNHWHCRGWRCFLKNGDSSTSRENKALPRDTWLHSFLLKAVGYCWTVWGTCNIWCTPEQGEFYMMLGNEHSIFSNISNLCIFSGKSALPSCKIKLFMEGENVARGQEPHLNLVCWVHVHTVHMFGFGQ